MRAEKNIFLRLQQPDALLKGFPAVSYTTAYALARLTVTARSRRRHHPVTMGSDRSPSAARFGRPPTFGRPARPGGHICTRERDRSGEADPAARTLDPIQKALPSVPPSLIVHKEALSAFVGSPLLPNLTAYPTRYSRIPPGAADFLHDVFAPPSPADMQSPMSFADGTLYDNT